MFKIFLLLNILITGVSHANPINVQSPDNSVSAVFDQRGFTELYINGDWNRLKNNIAVYGNKLEALDFYLGTYTALTTNKSRPVYHAVRDGNTLLLTAFEDGLYIRREIVFADGGQVSQKLTLSNTGISDVRLDNEGIAFSFGSLFDISRTVSNRSNIPEYRFFSKDGKMEKASLSPGGWFGSPQYQDFLQNVDWFSLADNYFMVVVDPQFEDSVVVYNAVEFAPENQVALGLQALATNIPANSAVEYSVNYYIGPRIESMVVDANPEYRRLFAWPVVFNWILKPIERFTTWFMAFLMRVTGSAGLTLILIAIAVKLMLLPLSIRSAMSMKKMRMLQPKLNKLQEKYGHDQQLVQMKTMELYRSEKVNPLGGCLPLLLQIPVFFALFRVLSRSVQLRGAGFLWIKDLTQPDTLFSIGAFHFHLLPVIMTGLQLVSVYLQQGRMGSTSNAMQKQMQTQGYIMPLVFLFLFWNMPSGLVLYWTVQNIFSIIEQEAINLDRHVGNKSI